MPPSTNTFQVKLSYRATTATSTCISFLLLSISLLSPSWLEVIVPEDNTPPSPVVNKLCNKVACGQFNENSGFTKASRILLTLATIVGFVAAFSLLISCQCPRHCRGPSNMLVSSAASFTTGIFGFATMALYTIDVTQRQMSSVSTLHFTWSFCLSWLVFTLYVMNGFFSLLIHLMSSASRVEWHMNPILLEENTQQPMAEGQAVGGLPALPQHEILLLQENPSLSLNSTVI